MIKFRKIKYFSITMGLDEDAFYGKTIDNIIDQLQLSLTISFEAFEEIFRQ